MRANVGMVYSCVGRHNEAIEQLRNTTELNPDYDFGYSALGMAYLRKAMYPEAIANLEKALAMDEDDPDVVLDMVDLAYAYAAAGRKNEARKMLSELERQEANGRKPGKPRALSHLLCSGREGPGLGLDGKGVQRKI
jgi:tetratricopeptide (TPR) repeat protein